MKYDEDLSKQLWGAIEYLSYPKPWRKCFAYLPVTVHGDSIWLTYYYERFNCQEDEYGNRHEFVERGTLFDVLKDNNER